MPRSKLMGKKPMLSVLTISVVAGVMSLFGITAANAVDDELTSTVTLVPETCDDGVSQIPYIDVVADLAPGENYDQLVINGFPYDTESEIHRGAGTWDYTYRVYDTTTGAEAFRSGSFVVESCPCPADLIVAPAPVQDGPVITFTSTSEYEYYDILTYQLITSPYVLAYESGINIGVRPSPTSNCSVSADAYYYQWPLDNGGDPGDGSGDGDGSGTPGDGGSDGGNTGGSDNGSGGSGDDSGVGGNTDSNVATDGTAGVGVSNTGADGANDQLRDAGAFATGDTVLAAQPSTTSEGSSFGVVLGLGSASVALVMLAGFFGWMYRRNTRHTTQSSQG